jgi:hypothetical protein
MFGFRSIKHEWQAGLFSGNSSFFQRRLLLLLVQGQGQARNSLFFG